MHEARHDINMKNNEGNSPLAIAAWKDDTTLGRYLIGVEGSNCLADENEDGNTYVHQLFVGALLTLFQTTSYCGKQG